MKIISTLTLILLFATLAGCATDSHVDLTTHTIPVAVPLVYSPAPPATVRPELPHLTIKPEDEKVDGKVVQAYAGSIEALLGYSKELEKVIENYKSINEAYAAVRQKLIDDWKKKTGVDITIEDPTIPKPTP